MRRLSRIEERSEKEDNTDPGNQKHGASAEGAVSDCPCDTNEQHMPLAIEGKNKVSERACACVCVCMCTCTCMCVHVRVLCTCVHVYLCACTCIVHVCACLYVYVHVCFCTCLHVFMCTHVSYGNSVTCVMTPAQNPSLMASAGQTQPPPSERELCAPRRPVPSAVFIDNDCVAVIV